LSPLGAGLIRTTVHVTAAATEIVQMMKATTPRRLRTVDKAALE
jgi:hypothetical protein